MNIRFPTHSLSWNSPLLPQVVEYLLNETRGDVPWALDHLIVLTPTRQAGRRLHEALVTKAHQAQSGLFPPRILTPDALFHQASEKSNNPGFSAASRTLVLASWAAVLKEISLESYRRVFPVDPLSHDSQWALRIAVQFERLQSQLSEHDLDFQKVADHVSGTHLEPERWQELAQLEALYRNKLQQIEKQCPNQVRRQIAHHPCFDSSIRKIIVAGTPDPFPLSIQLLDSARQAGMEVVVLQYGPENEDPDLWLEDGRPNFNQWYRADLTLDDRLHFHLAHGPQEFARQTCQLMREVSSHSSTALGVLDPEFLPFIEQELTNQDIPQYNPAGISLADTEPGRVVQRIQDFALQKDFQPTWNLLRDPAFHQQVLALHLQKKIYSNPILKEIDQLQAKHLCHSPESLSAVLDQLPEQFPMTRSAFALLRQWKTLLIQQPFEQSLETLLLQYFGERWFTENQPEQRLMIEALQTFNELLFEIRELRTHYPHLNNSEIHSLLGNLIRQNTLYPERPEPSLDLQGWLEMLWEDSPRLVLAGFHDGVVPSHIHGDAFLPETLRQFLGMTSNEQRLGRDAYLLHALLASRSDEKSVHILIARWAPSGSSLKPSRLLFQTRDPDLFLKQVNELIRDDPAPEESPQHVSPFQIRPPLPNEQPKRLSVTGFRQFLSNPFDFYLRHILGWDSYPMRKSEMDAADFGTLFHAIMQKMTNQTRGQPIDSVQSLLSLMEEIAADQMQRLFGGDYSFPVRLQWENLKTRLRRCAEIEMEIRSDGWVNLETECKVEYLIDGWTIRGTIDRIDHHPGRGLYRIIDYKTGSAQKDSPQASHYKQVKSNTLPPVIPEAQFSVTSGNKTESRQWLDLQLPLYALASQQLLDLNNTAALPELCYFIAPPSAEKVELSAPWAISQEELTEAQHCIRGVLHAIEHHQFWTEQDTRSFRACFPDGIHRAINPEPFISS